MSQYTLLQRALSVSVESMTEELTPEDIQEQYEELESSSTDISIEDLMADEHEVQHVTEQLAVVREMVEQVPPEAKVVSFESLNRLVDTISMRYGQTETTSLESLSADDARENLLNRIDTLQTSLEAALTVSQESWSVKDLWDRAGGVERNSVELESALKQLDSRKQWFSENGIIIDSLGQLQYMSVNEQFTKNLTKDTETTVKHVEDLLATADVALSTSEKLAKLVANAQIVSDDDAVTLLAKAVELANPSQMGKQKLDGVFLLNNEHSEFQISPLKSPAGIPLKNWENIGYYSKSSLAKVKHGTKASRFLRLPAWLAGATVGSHATTAMMAGTGVIGSALGLGVGVVIGFAASGMVNDRKAGKQTKHNIKYDEIHSSFDKVVALARKSASRRRQLPGLFKKATAGRDDTIKRIDSLMTTCGSEGKAALKVLRTICMSSDRVGWALNLWAFGIMEQVTRNSNAIARKMIKSSK